MKVVFSGLSKIPSEFIDKTLPNCGGGPCGCWALFAIDACTATGSYADIYTTTLDPH